MQTSCIITRPDDWHVHLRTGDLLPYTAMASAQHFARALVMPNLQPPLISRNALLQYRERILELAPGFMPYVTYYLNADINPADLANPHPAILGGKLYPANVTTNSAAGIADINSLWPLLEIMQDNNLVLQIHGESTSGDVFCREQIFLEQSLPAIMKKFPRLRIVLEHISSSAAVDFITNAPDNLAATITPHHLLYNRNDMLAGGIRPHYYCMPILKTQQDQQALITAATSGNPKFFAGTDSAPHIASTKETACGCAGIYTAPIAVALYAEVFAKSEKLARLERFLSHYGADFYQLPHNSTHIELVRDNFIIPQQYHYGTHTIIPPGAGNTLAWRVSGE